MFLKEAQVLRAALFCFALTLGLVPLAAAAESVDQTQTPDRTPVIAQASSSASPTPASATERFVQVDGALTGTTYNELSPGSSTGGIGVRAVAEFPIIGHNWMAQLDFRSYNYAHPALGGTPNGLIFGCPTANDPGCVTPIGYKTYNGAFTPGPVNYLNAVNVSDTTTQLGLGSKIAPRERYYISVGWIIRSFNYLGYPAQNGLGFGIDKLPDVDRAMSFYGNFWIYFNVNGNYVGPTSAALGALSATKFTVGYHMYAYRVGFTFAVPRTPLFVDLSDVGDNVDVSAFGPSNALHNELNMGLGAHF